MTEWFEEFFDDLYYDTYSVFEDEERNEREARFIADALGLAPGSLVMDLGCGYARHAVHLAKWGYKVICLDLSRHLLERARGRVSRFGVGDRVELVRADMRSLEYESEFDGIYMFFTTFGYFSDRDNARVLEGVARALKPNGVLLIDLLNPARIMHHAYIYGGVRRTWYKAGDYVVLEESNYDIRGGRIDTRRIFYKGGSVAAERRFTIRFYMYWEIEKMLESVGMVIERAYGSYSGDGYSVASPRMIVVARKIEEA